MIARLLLRVILLAAAFALATAWFGWWAVPLVAFAWGVMALAVTRAALIVAVSAALGWLALLFWTTMHGPVSALAHLLASTMHVPSVALVLVTLIFPAVLAWSAASLAAAARVVVGVATRAIDS